MESKRKNFFMVDNSTVLVWIDKFGMPGVKIGRTWKFKVSEVDNWMKSSQKNKVKEKC